MAPMTTPKIFTSNQATKDPERIMSAATEPHTLQATFFIIVSLLLYFLLFCCFSPEIEFVLLNES
jgi:hypothetical protein